MKWKGIVIVSMVPGMVIACALVFRANTPRPLAAILACPGAEAVYQDDIGVLTVSKPARCPITNAIMHHAEQININGFIFVRTLCDRMARDGSYSGHSASGECTVSFRIADGNSMHLVDMYDMDGMDGILFRLSCPGSVN